MNADTIALCCLGIILWGGLCAGIAGLALFLCFWMADRFPDRLVRRNFQGNSVPVIGGLALLAAQAGWLIWLYGMMRSDDEYQNYWQIGAATVALLGFGCLGLVDDLYGDRSTRGFRGHFRTFIVERRVTTGFIKAVGGGLAALTCGALLEWGRLLGTAVQTDSIVSVQWPSYAGAVLLDTLVIALSANTLNLLDLRPGRASLAALLSGVLLPLAAVRSLTESTYMIAAGLLGMGLLLYMYDRSGKIMLGDCGSNALGAVLAVCWICVLTRWEIAIGVVLLATFQIWCEKHSLSRFIESKPLLRALDRKIGVR